MTATIRRTTDVLLHMIVTLLTPMFLTTTSDIDQAYAAALATVRSCTARNPMDLLLIGQMIAFGLATLTSISLSMEDNIPINQILRLRGNAVSLHRASEECRRALPEPEPDLADADTPLTAAELQHEAEVIAEVEQTRNRVAEYQARFAPSKATPAAPATVANLRPDAAKSPDETRPATVQATIEPARRNATPFNRESTLRAACTLAYPDATQAEIDAMIEDAMAESRTETTHNNHLINGTSPPPGWPQMPSHLPDSRDTA